MTPGLQHPPAVVQRPGMPSGARMPHQGAPMGPPGSPYMGSPAVRPGLAPAGMEPARKRAAPPPGQSQAQSQGQPVPTAPARSRSAKRRKMADKILPQRIRELVPESQAYMDLLAFERKLDQTIMRKRVDIQEALKRPMKQKRKLRLYISNTFNPAKPDAEDSDGSIASWELRVEGKLLDDPSKQKRKFSSFFKSLVIELDKDLYGPDNHLVEWHRTPTTQETDGFQVKRPGDLSVRCTLLLMLDYQPPQFKLDPRLARLLGLHTQSRSAIVQALWQYVKTNRLQDSHDKEYINGDKYFQQIFDCPRLKFSEIPQRLTALLLPPDPIVINHVISVDPSDQKKTACYDIDVEVEEPLKGQMSSFLLSTANQQEISALDSKIHETIESINQLKIQRDFMLSFSRDPKGYIQDLLRSQSRDLKVMTDVAGNPEEERRAEFYHQPWSQEAVSRYFYCKVWRGPGTSGLPLPSLQEKPPFPAPSVALAPAPAPQHGGALPAPRCSSGVAGWSGLPCHSPATASPCYCSYFPKDPAAQAGAGAVAGCTQHLGAPVKEPPRASGPGPCPPGLCPHSSDTFRVRQGND
ncbi:SWI/SNF-related matrix-associated actin-dependent regulator of chromatin subfamily D member 3 isoform X2 [Ailuropoda melanoleuca]|uniref:SWI/SNF-related matrix-associated actin-dependent regulator of chromatin subfamily D member 3 isoform X2 n=1 Tax=Ailuropoda melanoleuca TaxID=9646 RepID=UPI001494576E|nr:SWI/SNF-related matrix-associated actin-dependent regulator of chromatin subfamily D member 3 isoform X2 [Ailuropoda melanoleuca]